MARRRNPLNPFNETKGFFGAFGRALWTVTGPAAVGIGRPEEPYVPPANPTCPLCGALMADHRIERGTGTTATRLHCPPAAV